MKINIENVTGRSTAFYDVKLTINNFAIYFLLKYD
jgi:hypothetical protein